MIFSKLFKAKWQHKDSNVRIEAINTELNVEQDAETILQLANNDDNELVRRAALIKLNKFEVWLEASKTNAHSKTKDFAQKQIIEMLHNKHNIVLSDEQKLHFISGKHQNHLLEEWLHVEQTPSIIIALYNRLAKPQLIQPLFVQKQNQEVQNFLIDQTDNVSLLERLSKKSIDSTVSKKIASKLSSIAELAEKPVKVKKHLQLVLAKLLALKDVKTYDEFIQKQENYHIEWHESFGDIDYLTDIDKQTILTKFDDISAQLNKIFAAKKEAYEQEQIALKLNENKLKAQHVYSQTITDLTHALTTAVFENQTLNEADFMKNLASLTNDITSSVLNKNEQAEYLVKVEALEKRLTALPEIAESVTEATRLISKISQLSIPQSINELNERHPIYKEWLTSWTAIEKKTDGVLPDSIKHSHDEIVKSWRAGLKPILAEQKHQFNHVQKKLSELKRLLFSGKYNASFGLFKKINKIYENFSPAQKQRLQRDYDVVNEKIAEISDWEHYIATPRKQQLLDEMEALVKLPLDNPHEQAEKVKQFRKTWNSLGHAEEDLDKPLNEAFDVACEQAFAPCRLYYAEQEKLREQHLTVRVKLVDKAKGLIDALKIEPIDFKYIDGQLNKLNQQWKTAGDIDRAKYKTLHHDFTQALLPLKTAVREFHEQNIELKNDLINKAKALVDNDDVYKAIDDLKLMQQKWRSIGYAGPRQENKLWQNFRAINDALFEKRDQLKAQLQHEQASQQAIFLDQLNELKTSLPLLTDKSQLNGLRNKADELHNDVISVKPVLKNVLFQIEAFIKDITAKLSHLELVSKKQNFLNVFELLEQLTKSEFSNVSLTEQPIYQQLSNYWQKKIDEVISNKDSGDRATKTLEIEILAGIETPKAYAQDRMQVQVSLMQSQMSSGESTDLQASFLTWLQLGKFTEKDSDYIARIKPVYC